MSLIVAKTTECGPCIVADTRVSFRDGKKSSYRNGTLKAIALSPEIALCFAGDVTQGLAAARKVNTRLKEGVANDTLLQDLVKISAAAQGDVDFILALQRPQPQLARIRNGIVEDDLLTAWIGDQDGFDYFQQSWHSICAEPPVPTAPAMILSGPASFTIGPMVFTFTPDAPPHGEPQEICEAPKPVANELSSAAVQLEGMAAAMRRVIDNPSLPSVGDICVRLTSKNHQFRYLSEMGIYVGRDIVLRDGDDMINAMAQPVEDGGFAICMVEPFEPGIPALGLCFPRARIAMIYLPLECEEAQVIRDIKSADFPRFVESKYGINMSRPMLCEKIESRSS